jgi:hypothetical protein
LVILVSSCKHAESKRDHREAFMRLMDSALQNYASDHSGWLPSGDDPFAALSKLFPDYCAPGDELAGLSGNIPKTVKSLEAGRSISDYTSWVYISGLRTDDDLRIAVLWESASGICQNGAPTSNNSRPVLLLNRAITNISADIWPEFLKEQEELWRTTIASRQGKPRRLRRPHPLGQM